MAITAVIVVLAVPAALVAAEPNADGPTAPLVALSAIAGVVIFAALGAWRSREYWLGAAGVGVVLISSGLGRASIETMPSGAGDVTSGLDTWVIGLVIGAAMVVAAFAWAVWGTPPATWIRSTVGSALASLLIMIAGLVALAALLQDLVTGQVVVGRPVRRRGRAIPTPEVVDRRGRCSTGSEAAGQWLAAADEEAASVAAFCELADRLTAVAAPRSLVDRCRDAAADEVRHTRLCRRLASLNDRGDGPTEAGPRPGPAMPPPSPRPSPVTGPARRVALALLAAESLVDGVIGEGFSAARLKAGEADAPLAVAAVLRSLAVDEARHAALGADIVAWCRSESPRLVGAALRCSFRRSSTVDLSSLHGEIPDADLRVAGIVDRATARSLWAAQRSTAAAQVR